MKLTEFQIYKIDVALENSQSVLGELVVQIKQKKLEGNDLKRMKILESIVENLEIFRATVS